MSLDMLASVVLVISALIVMSEALEALEHCKPSAPGLSRRDRVQQGLKAGAWFLLALGAGGGVAVPLLPFLGVQDASWLPKVMRLDVPTLDHVVTMLGAAILVVRKRFTQRG